MTSQPFNKPNRVWTNPDSKKDESSLVYLKPDMLCLAVIPSGDLEKAAATVESGGEIASQTIPLSAVTKVQGTEAESDLTVTYKQGESEAEPATIALADTAQRDEFLAVLQERLGSGWIEQRQQESRFKAALWPGGILIGLALLTWIMHYEALEIAAGKQLKPLGRRSRARFVSAIMHWLEGLLGATGILILGAVLGLLALLWLAYAVANPTVRITLQPREQ
jgi:hypothetical protein